MSRSTPEWIAAHDDQAIPAHIKLRVYVLHDGTCAKCTRKLERGQWDCDHVIALANGGRHAESKSPCHSQKTKADVAEKSMIYRKRAKHLGLKPPRQKIQSAGFRRVEPQHTASRPIQRRS
jgi:5-methylcytosine-specific restriction protein A